MKIKRILFFLPFLWFPLSCSDFFTHSLAEWAQRDPGSLIPEVTPGNVEELIRLSENNPGMSLEVLKGIAGSDKKSDPAMQAAALRAAANAADIANSLLKNISDVASGSMDSATSRSVMIDAVGDMQNLADTGAALRAILPNSTVSTDYDGLDPADLAIAAMVLLAAEARQTGDAAGYIDSVPSGPGTGNLAVIKAMAQSSKSRYTGGGFLGDLLDNLNLAA
ncbi:MAG: hypothetical protein LBK77_04935 [Spirochaetaceae bacterium]|jgi:hypothetical protein|nr:hypothetical protein [Spirochaetaceae bacterium]